MSRRKLTPWACTAEQVPAIEGEYIASNCRSMRARRWWNGKTWSSVYYKSDSQHIQNVRAGLKVDKADSAEIWWRGLASPPKSKEVAA